MKRKMTSFSSLRYHNSQVRASFLPSSIKTANIHLFSLPSFFHESKIRIAKEITRFEPKLNVHSKGNQQEGETEIDAVFIFEFETRIHENFNLLLESHASQEGWNVKNTGIEIGERNVKIHICELPSGLPEKIDTSRKERNSRRVRKKRRESEWKERRKLKERRKVNGNGN